MRSADIDAMMSMAGDPGMDGPTRDDMAALWEINKHRERLSELALLDCARLGLADDLLRHLCVETGVKYSNIIKQL